VSNYYSIITERGLEKLALSKANGKAVKLKTIAVGDSQGRDDALPSGNQSALIREVYRAEINRLFQHEQDANILVAELHIPSNVGGFIIREAGIFDEDGELFAVGRYPATVKPNLSDGIAREEIVQLAIAHSNNSQIELKIDPSIVMASRAYVNESLLEAIERRTYISIGKNRDYPDLQTAWDSIKGKRLVAPLTLQLIDGVHEYDKPLQLNNPPKGNTVNIIGNNDNPDAVTLKLTQRSGSIFMSVKGADNVSLSGFNFDMGQHCDYALQALSSYLYLENIHFNNTAYALWLTSQATLIAQNIAIRDCNFGLVCEYNSHAHLSNSTLSGPFSNKEGSIGIIASLNSIATAKNTDIKNYFVGLQSTSDSHIVVESSTVSECNQGVHTTLKSSLMVNSTTFSHCAYAVYTSDNSYSYVPNNTITHCNIGFYATLQSFIRAENTSQAITDCNTPYSPPVSLLEGNHNSQIYWS